MTSHRLGACPLPPRTPRSGPYLTNVVPDGVDRILDVFGLELLGSDVDDGVRIGLALAEDVAVLLHQVFALDQPQTQHTLGDGEGREMGDGRVPGMGGSA